MRVQYPIPPSSYPGQEAPCNSYFDAHRSRAHLLQAPELQLHPRTSNVTGLEGAGDAVEDPSSDEERATTDDETDAEATSAEKPWCPPIPDTPDDSTEKRDRWSRGQVGNHDEWFSTAGEYLLPARRTSGLVATGEIDHLVDFHTRQVS